MEGGLSHLGIGEEEVRRMNPSVIHASISPFGATGPYATWKSSSLLDWAASGYLFITGDPDREPLAGPEGICEAVCAYTAAMAIEAALAARRNTGRGCYIDASVMEAMVCSHQSTFSRYAAGMVMGRSGNEVATCYPLGVKRCRDGHILISVVTDQDFDRLAIAMGLPHLVADPRFSDGTSRYRHRDSIDAVLDPWLRSMDGDDIAGLLQTAGVVASKVVTTLDLLSDPQLESRHFLDTMAMAMAMIGWGFGCPAIRFGRLVVHRARSGARRRVEGTWTGYKSSCREVGSWLASLDRHLNRPQGSRSVPRGDH